MNGFYDEKQEQNVPVRGVLIQLSKLPVHRVDVHVVVLLKVLREQLNRVITSMKTPLTLKDFLHLQNTRLTLIKLLTTYILCKFSFCDF